MNVASLVLIFCRVVLGLVFALSFGSKLRDVHAFARTIVLFAPFPRRVALPVAWALLLLELGIALALTAGGALLAPGFVVAAALLLCFSLVLAWALRRKIAAPCRCFGSGQHPIAPADLWRNGGLICCALAGYQAVGPGSSPASQLGALELLLVVLAALAFVAIWLHLAEIVQLFRVS